MNTIHLASNILRLQPNVRSLLRRNICLLLKAVCGSVPNISRHNRKILMDFTERQAQSFCFVLYMLLSRYDDEPFPEHMFDIFNVRNVDRAHREAYFLEAIEHYRPDLVILDGIRDLVSDINDGTVAQDMMEKLMKTAQAFNCCIVCVLHQNKSGDSRDPRGWLGTELLNRRYGRMVPPSEASPKIGVLPYRST